MLDVGCRKLDVGCRKLDVGCWMLDVGCSVLDFLILPSAYPTYAHMVSSQKNVLSTFFRSVIHATVSTCNGCSAKSPATIALRQKAPVIRRKTTSSSSALAIW